MDAIPFAIYAAPMSIFRSDVALLLGCNEQHCYLQLLSRISYLSHAVLVASSCDDLLALHRGEADEAIKQRVLVTTISRQYLHHHCSLILAPQAEAPLYAAPAAILADKDLLIASAAWLTYFRVLRCHADGSARIRLAAQPARVDTDHAYFTTLTREEFAQALPVGRRELNLTTCDLLELVEAHAQAVTGRPVEHIAPVVDMDNEEDERDTQSAPAAARSYPPEVVQMLRIKDEDQPRHKAHPQLLDKPQLLESVYVSAEVAQRTMQQFTRHTGTVPLLHTLRQKAWLQAALSAIKQYQQQDGEDQARLALQDERLRVVLVHGVFAAARLVQIEPVGEPSGPSQRAVCRGHYVHVEKIVAA